MDTKKIVKTQDNVIDFHADAKEMLRSPKGTRNNKIVKGNLKKTEVVRGLAQPSRKIDFLNDQLGNAKNELSISRQNHSALVDQIIFAQKDFKRRLRAASEERRSTEEKYNKVSAAFSLKEKEAEANAKKVHELKEKFNKLHAAYSEKIEKFKEQHKARIEGKETLAEKKMKILQIEKEKMQKSVNYLMDAVYQRSEKITVYEKDLKTLRTEVLDLNQMNESLKTFKEENQHSVSSLNSEMMILREELDQAVKILQDKEKELDQTTFKLKSTNEELDEVTTKAEDFQQKFFGLQNEIEIKRSKISSYEQLISDLRVKEKEGEELADEVRDFQILEASLQGEIHSLKEKEEKYKESISAQNRNLDEYKDKLKKLEYTIGTLQTDFDESNKKFTGQIAGYEKEVSELQALKKENEQDIQGLKRNITGLKVGIDDKDNQIEELSAKLDSLEGLNERYSNECASLEDHISEITAELKSTKEEGNASMANINSLNEKVFTLSGELLDIKEEKENLQIQIGDLNARIDAERSKYQLLEEELAEKIEALSEAKDREADFLEAKLEWEDDKEVLELRISDFSKSVEEKDQEIIQKQDKLEEYLKQFRDLNADLDRTKKDLAEIESEKITLVKGKESLISKNEQLSYKKSQLETFVKDGEAKITKLNNQVNELEKKVFTGDQIIVSLEKKLAESGGAYAAENKSLKRELDLLVKEQQETKYVKKGTEAEITNVQSVLGKTRKELEAAKAQIEDYKLKIRDLEASNKTKEASLVEFNELKEKFENLSNQEDASEGELKERREELGLYSRWVDSQKESLKNHIVRFTQELKLSLTINPLHSYLAMTEKELSKVELLLAKPGILGEQRAHLEDHHKILMEQKRYIGQMVAKTKADVEKRVTEVVGLLKQGDFIPVPPLPPQKK